MHAIVVQLDWIRYMRYIMFTYMVAQYYLSCRTHGRCDQILQFVRKARAYRNHFSVSFFKSLISRR